MTVLSTDVDITSSTHLGQIPEVQSAAVADASTNNLNRFAAGGGDRPSQRHHEERGKLLRERIELLPDRDALFMELSALAAWGHRVQAWEPHRHRRGIVSGVECMIIAHLTPPCVAAR